MNLAGKLVLQASVFSALGALAGHYLAPLLPKETASELLLALGNMSAIAGSLLGWSVGWLSQSRGLVKEIDYQAARQLFRDLGSMQKELIWRWGVVFMCSITVVITSVILKDKNLDPALHKQLLLVASVFISIALGFIAYLFERMLALAGLKAELDEFEHDELRKGRLKPDDE